MPCFYFTHPLFSYQNNFICHISSFGLCGVFSSIFFSFFSRKIGKAQPEKFRHGKDIYYINSSLELF